VHRISRGSRLRERLRKDSRLRERLRKALLVVATLRRCSHFALCRERNFGPPCVRARSAHCSSESPNNRDIAVGNTGNNRLHEFTPNGRIVGSRLLDAGPAGGRADATGIRLRLGGDASRKRMEPG
jgi:hypothetical protein